MKYAALITSSQHIPGDERSRTNPGHGYPAHTIETTEIKEFKDENEMKAWVAYSTRRFRLIRYEELTYETKVSVAIKPA